MTENQVKAYQDALDAEYVAVYAYGLIGGKTDDAGRPLASAAITTHRAARDRLREEMATLGITAAPPATAYDTGQISQPAEAAELAVQVELTLAPRYAELCRYVTGSQRGWCAAQAQQAASRAVAWGGATAAFPGLVPAETTQPS